MGLGKGFDKTNLWHMRKFYNVFEKLDSLRRELSWTHYRQLLKVEDAQTRVFYITESVEANWSTRTLERQIGNLYYQRMELSSNNDFVKEEAVEKQIIQKPKDVIKDPNILALYF